MPTRNRALLFERALGSVIGAAATVADDVEVTVSDGSDDDATGQVVERLLADCPGGCQYVHNRPMLPLVDNMNRATELASGAWVMQLDDDDYLLPGAGAAMIDAIRRVGPDEQVLMFGVQVVERLIGKGFEVCIYDANVNLAKVVGANKSYILDQIPTSPT